MNEPTSDPIEPETAATAGHQPTRLADNLSHRIPVLASRVRAQLLFMVLDAVCVLAGYSAAEVFFWRNVAPTAYGWHFALFLLIVLFVPRGIVPTGGEWIRRLRTRGRPAVPPVPTAVPAPAPPEGSDAPVTEARR